MSIDEPVGLIAMISTATTNRILASWPVGVLSTYGKHAIHSVPIVFAVVGDGVFSPIDGKPKSGRRLQRVRDIERDPRYTLLLQHYDDDWRQLWWLRITGEARVVTGAELDDGVYRDVIAALRNKYVQYQETAVLDESGQLLHLSANDRTAWAFAGLEWLEQQHL